MSYSPKPGDVVEIRNTDPPRFAVVMSGSKKMFMVGETVLVLENGQVERYLKERLKIVKVERD